jgi:hypothetical protein
VARPPEVEVPAGYESRLALYYRMRREVARHDALVRKSHADVGQMCDRLARSAERVRKEANQRAQLDAQELMAVQERANEESDRLKRALEAADQRALGDADAIRSAQVHIEHLKRVIDEDRAKHVEAMRVYRAHQQQHRMRVGPFGPPVEPAREPAHLSGGMWMDNLH